MILVIIMGHASMQSTLTHVPVQLVLLGPIVRSTLMNVLESPVKMVKSAMMVSTPTHVPVQLGSLGTNVRPTLMNVNQIVVRMVGLVLMQSIAIAAHVERDSMELIVSYYYYNFLNCFYKTFTIFKIKIQGYTATHISCQLTNISYLLKLIILETLFLVFLLIQVISYIGVLKHLKTFISG